MLQKKREKKLGVAVVLLANVFFEGGKCLNLGVVNVRILGVVNVPLANDSQSCKDGDITMVVEVTITVEVTLVADYIKVLGIAMVVELTKVVGVTKVVGIAKVVTVTMVCSATKAKKAARRAKKPA